MMYRTSIFALFAAAMTFAAEGDNITVNLSVDSHIGSVTLQSGQQSDHVDRNGSATWTAWQPGVAYAASASSVDAGYTARWKVTKSGAETLSGGMNDAITLAASYAGCNLTFFGEPNTYGVTLDRQSGNGGSSSVTATFDAAMPTATMPTRTGYTFGGYYTAENGGGTQYYKADGTSAKNWDKTSATTLYANWTAVTSTVTLDMQSGSGGSSSVAATFDAAMPTATMPTRTGYTFGGYYTAENGGGTQYYKADGTSAKNWDKTTATTLYAKWTAITYTVTLDKQGGTGGGNDVTVIYGQAMPAITVPTRTGYTFGGYYTAENGGGTQYYKADGTSAKNWDKTTATTLYAKWTANTYRVTLEKRDGTGGDNYVTATYGSPMPTPRTAPTRQGYTFGGYYTSANGGGTQYYDGSMKSVRDWDISSATTLYARWTAITCTVTLDKQGGTGGDNGVTVTYGQAMPAITVPTRTGYTFGGYYTAENDGGMQYYKADGTSAKNWDRTSATTLYAKWTTSTYTVTLDRQSGSGGAPSVKATYNAAMPTPIDLPRRTGYAFGGYYTSKNGGGTQYYTSVGASARNWNIASNTTLYAKWTTNTYAVTLDMQSGTGGATNVTATYDAAMPTLTNLPVRTGHSFGGYYTAPNGSGTQYYTSAGTSARNWNIASNTTLYANWTGSVYKVTLGQNGGSGGSTNVQATYGSAMPSATMPRRTGYTFDGYWDTVNPGGTQYYDGNMKGVRDWDKASTATLWAKWTANRYKVTLEKRDGTGGDDYVTATYGSPMPTPRRAPTRPGYTFGGYYTSANGGGTQYYDDSMESVRDWDINSAATLYAKWTANPYRVTLDKQGGTGGDSYVTATYGSAMPTPRTAPTRTGYTFAGYYTEANGGGKKYYDDGMKSVSNWDVASATTLYAKWTAQTYAVTFGKNKGSGGSDGVTATFDAAMPSITPPTRTGYTFGGYWNTLNPGGTQYYTAGGTSAKNWDKTSATTLWAKWTANRYKVTLDKQGGTGGDNYVTATYDSPMPTPRTAPSRQGYTFGGYYTAANGGGTQYYDGSMESVRDWDINSEKTLYASWTGVVYTVAFDANGAEGTMDPITCTYDVPTNLPPCGFTRDGYGFKGWTTNVTDGVLFSDRARVTNLTATAGAEVTMYACWTGATYQVVLDARDAQDARFDGVMTDAAGDYVSVLTNSYVVGEPWELPSKENKGIQNKNIHWEFVRWKYVDAQGVTNDVPDVVPPPSDGVTNLIATWTWVNDEYGVAVDAPDLGFDSFGTVGTQGHHNEDWHPAQWSVTNVACANVYDSTNAVQSGTLPQRADDELIYASWLTTEVRGKGVLTFWWKCRAAIRDHIEETIPGDDTPIYRYVGDSFHFGQYDGDVASGGFKDLIPELEGTNDWCRVAYTNEVDGPVTFAWKFQFESAKGSQNGGGAGWVDGVTWVPREAYGVTLDARDARGDGMMENNDGDVVSVLTNLYYIGDEWNLPVPTNANVNLEFSGWVHVDAQGVTNEVPDTVPPLSEGVTNLVAVWNLKEVGPVNPDDPFDPSDLAAAVDAPKLKFTTFGTVGIQGHHNEDEYLANWVAQTNVVYDVEDNPSAAQSGVLPQNGDGMIYASWLTTTVSGKGVLTFWWKCEASTREEEEYQDSSGEDIYVYYGETFHFGRYDGDAASGGFVDLASELEGVTGWRQVVYTNEIDGPVTFAWKFQYKSSVESQNGGGTGWVDRVTWTPDESAMGDATTTHAVPYSWLRANFSGYESASADELEALAEGNSSNGKPMKVWEEYWAGTNPNDPNDLFRAYIAVSNDVAHITWYPDLSVTGVPRRVYHVWRAPTLPAGWVKSLENVKEEAEVELPGAGGSGASAKGFFKIELDWEGSKENND